MGLSPSEMKYIYLFYKSKKIYSSESKNFHQSKSFYLNGLMSRVHLNIAGKSSFVFNLLSIV